MNYRIIKILMFNLVKIDYEISAKLNEFGKEVVKDFSSYRQTTTPIVSYLYRLVY